MNADALAAPTASNLQQRQHTPAMQAMSAAPQPQLHGSGGGYGSGVNAQAFDGARFDSSRPPSTHCHPVTAPSYQLTPLYSDGGPISKNETPARIVPIAALNPYQGRWIIKARATAKGELRQYKNAKGEGKVFNFVLLDAEGGEIRVTCMNNVADQFYSRTEVGKVYMLSKGSLKPTQRAFNHLKSDWEIYLENTSTLEPCYEDDGSIPYQVFAFKQIAEIDNMEANSVVDLIGVVVTIKPTTIIMRRNGAEAQKRSLQLLDISGRSVEVIMWGTFCSNEGQQLQDLCVSGQFPVLALKAGRISDFSGTSVSTIPLSQLLVNPNLPQAFEVKEWFERLGGTMASQSVSRKGAGGGRTNISQIKHEGLGRSEKSDLITMKATLSFIKTDTFCYTACPLPVGDRQCNEKVINNGHGSWRCDRCDKSVAECDYRYLLSFQVQDHTGATWFTAFQEAAEEMMGISAKELYTWKQDETIKFQELIGKLLYSQYLFRLTVKEESYNGGHLVKSTVIKSKRLDFAAESRLLIDLIGKLSRGEPIGGPTGRVRASSDRYGGPTRAGIVPVGDFGGKAMVEDHQVQAKSIQTQITTFFQPMTKGP